MQPEGMQPWPFWHLLSAEQKELVQRHTALRRCMAGTLLLDEQSGAIGAILVESGRLRVFMIGSEGRTVSLHYLEKGECMLLGGTLADGSALLGLLLEADRDSTVMTIPAQTADYLMAHNHQALQWAYGSVTACAGKMLRAVHRVLFAGMHQRMAQGLLAQRERQGSCRLRITQERLAREISSSREVVTRTLGEFAQGGLVRLGRGQIEILNEDAVRRLAGGEEAAKRGESL